VAAVTTKFSKIQWGDGLSVTDEGDGVIRVDSGGSGGGGGTGPPGPPGADGVGVPAGGTTGQVLAKNSGSDYDTSWQTPPGGGAGGSWLPLTTTNSSGDDVLVFDADHSLIPTLVPF
jgi:hypothetical protein